MEQWIIFKETKSCNRWGEARVYEISNLGRVRINGEIIELGTIKGYASICNLYVHRLVATYFIPNPDNKREVDHINNDKLDNRACNLRWVTREENMHNPITKERMTAIHTKKKPYSTRIKMSESAKIGWTKRKRGQI